MRCLLFAAVLALAVTMAAAQARPRLPETFEMLAVAHVWFNGSSYFGEGGWAVDQPNGRAVERMEFGGFRHFDVHDLQRFDMKKAYNVFWVGDSKKECHTRDLNTNKMPLVWDWLDQAELSHNVTEGGEVYNIWRRHLAGVELEVGVPAKNPTEVYFFSRRHHHMHVRLYVQRWSAAQPKPEWFNVPKECTSTAAPIDINSF